MTRPAVDEPALEARAAISAAAVRLFVNQGYDATTVDQIAREAGSSRATVFRHFGSKEDIVFHRYDRELERLCAGMSAVKGSDARRARGVLLDVASRLQAEGEAFRLELGLIARSPKLRARAFLTLHAWGCVLAEELAAGRDSTAELPARVLAHSAVVALQEAMCLWLVQPETSLVELAEEALRLALRSGPRR